MKTPTLRIASLVFILALFLGTVSDLAHAGLCSDEIITQYLGSPVEETLSNTRVVYAADSNFKKLVAESKRPLMVLIYNNDQDFSKGLAAVATCVLSEFPQFKFIAYDVRELSQMELDRAAHFTGGMASNVPSLYIYKYQKEELLLAGSIKEGYRETDLVKKQIKRISQFVWDKVLR